MPPPGFGSSSAAPGLHNTGLPVPKATQHRLKDTFNRIRIALLSKEGSRSAVGKTAAGDVAAAEAAISLLLDDPNATPAPSSVLARDAAWQLSTQIAQKFNADLVDIFLQEMDQGDKDKVSRLIGFLALLGDFLGSAAIVMEWWDLVLRPALLLALSLLLLAWGASLHAWLECLLKVSLHTVLRLVSRCRQEWAPSLLHRACTLFLWPVLAEICSHSGFAPR